MGGSIITGIMLGFCAILMIGIGISQYKSKKPIAFYTGEKGPEEKDLTDVDAWNKKHGIMWILYGICFILIWICGFLLGDSLLVLIPFLGGILVPIPVMIWYHHRLVKMYYVGHPDQKKK